MTSTIGKVFISHSSADKPFVDRLAVDLAKSQIPIWYDKLDIRVGDSVTGRINEGLSDAQHFLIVLSKASVGSRWVTEELNAALVQQVARGGTFLLPVLIEDCDIPPLLRHRRYADFRTNYNAGLQDLLNVWGKDADAVSILEGKALYPWPDVLADDWEFVYLHSARFDKFFRMSCQMSNTANQTIEYIVETLQLPWTQNVPQLGMKWTFSYRIIFNQQAIPLSKSLQDAGIKIGSVLNLGINGTYEDLWEKELKNMWDGTKIYEAGGAMAREAFLRQSMRERGAMTSNRLRDLANACFSHI